MQEVANVLVALALVTGRAGRHQITHAVGAMLAARMHVIEFQWHLAPITVGTLMIPLEQHVFAHLVACQCPLLILCPERVRVLQRLHVKAHEFLTDGRYRTQPQEMARPREDVADAALQRGWQRAHVLAAVLKARFPVSGFALPATPPDGTPGVQISLDLLAAMREFGRPHDLTARVVDQSKSRRSTSRIELEAQRLKMRRLHRFLEDDRERIPAIDRRLAFFEQETGAPGMHRTQPLFLRIKDKDFRHG